MIPCPNCGDPDYDGECEACFVERRMKLLSLMAEALDRGFAVCLKPLENGDYWASFGHVETPRDEWTGFDRSNWHDFCDDLTILIRDTLHPVTDVDPF